MSGGITDRSIIVKPEPFGLGFDVSVQPPVEGQALDREFASHREARGYAGGLRLVHRWPIVDQCGESGR